MSKNSSKNKNVSHKLEQTTFDAESGRLEQKTVDVSLILVDKKKQVEESWLIIWQGGEGMSLKQMAMSGEMTVTDYRVRDYLFCCLEVGNYLAISQAEIGRALDIKPSNINTSIKKLIKIGVLCVGDKKVGTHRTYTLNPCIGWKGTLQQGATEKRRHLRLVKTSQNEQKGG